MTEIKSYRSNENIITFSHVYRKHAYFITRGAHESKFTTIYKSCMMTWGVSVDTPTWLVQRNTAPIYQIALQGDGMRDKVPPVYKVEFQLRILTSDERDFITPLHHTIFPVENFEDNIFSMGYRTPEVSPISTALRIASNHPDFFDKKYEIVTRIDFLVSDLMKIENLTSAQAKPIPIDLDFRFASLMDKSRHNFKLVARDGSSFYVSKESIYVGSRWFREVLTDEMDQLSLDVATSQSIDTAVTFMLTERYKAPELLTPSLAKDIVHLVCLFGVKRISLLRRALERQGYEQVIKNHEDLIYLLDMLIASKEAGLYNLQGSCIACIISYHFTDFVRGFLVNTPPKYEIIKQAPHFQKSLLTMINMSYAQNQGVTSYVRQLPVEN